METGCAHTKLIGKCQGLPVTPTTFFHDRSHCADFNRKLHIQKNRGSNSDQGNSISSQGFGFGSPRTDRTGWDLFSNKHFRTVSWVFMYFRPEVLLSVTYPYFSHSTVGHKACYRMVFQLGPSSHVLHSVPGQFKFKPVEIRHFKVTGSN